jgi:pyruvate formate lyase activating enzyme
VGTGAGNRTILENVRRAAALGTVWLRIPLIAGFNDSDAHMRRIGRLASDIGARGISLLPYHEGGRAKTESLGRPYAFSEGLAPDGARLHQIKGLLANDGLEVFVGR